MSEQVFINIPGFTTWLPPVATVGQLPTNAVLGSAIVVTSTDNIYVWNGTSWVVVAGPGLIGPAFGIIQTDHGTYPTATHPTDTVDFTSSDGSVTITGNMGTDTVNFQVVPATPLSFVDSIINISGSVHLVNDSISPVSNSYYGTASNSTTLGYHTLPASSNYTFADSLVNNAGTVTLVNDTISPASNSYYGTNGSSILGYHSLVAPAGTLTGTTLNSTVVTSSLTSVGTIATGTWNGTTIAYNHGGTGQSSAFTQYGVVYASTTSALATTAAGTSGYVLTSNGSSAPTFQAPTGGSSPWQQIGGTGNPITQVDGTAPVQFSTIIQDISGIESIDPNVRTTNDSSGGISIDYNQRFLETSGTDITMDWSGNGYNSSSLVSFGTDIFSNPAVFMNGVFADNSSYNTTSININDHSLNGFATTAVPVDYSCRGFNPFATVSFDTIGSTFFSGGPPVIIVQAMGVTPGSTVNGALALTSTYILAVYDSGTSTWWNVATGNLGAPVIF